MAPVPDASCYEETCNPYACVGSGYVGLEHTSTPFFAQMNQWDSKVNPDHDPEISQSIREIVATRTGGFSHRESGKHVYVTNDNWSSSMGILAYTYMYREVFGAWYFDHEAIPNPGGNDKPAFKVIINNDGSPNLHNNYESLGGMCGGAYPK
jgi:hypothetical protein